jgi:tRNA(Ile)-lysidine synthase
VREAGTLVEAVRMIITGETAGYNPDHLLDPSLLSKELRVRNWRPGDRFWPAHTKSEKKIKELLQERQVTGTPRKTWPVVVSGNQIVWMRGFPVPASHQAKDQGEAVLIDERPLVEN